MRVIETSLADDLSLFSRFLWQERVAHRVFEERGRQVVELADPANADRVRAAYADWQTGRLTLTEPPPATAGRSARGRPRWLAALAAYPGLTALIGLALVAFPFTLPLAAGHVTGPAGLLTFLDPQGASTGLPGLAEVLAAGQLWRWFTPVFLHFSVVHLAFNCAVVIELGRRIEQASGPAGLWFIVLVTGVVSNLGQYGWQPNPLFGGLSGVAYGMLGYVLLRSRRCPEQAWWQLPRGFAVVLLGFLIVFSSGVTESFGLFVANAAHWSGLVCGALLGVVQPSAGRARAPDGGRS